MTERFDTTEYFATAVTEYVAEGVAPLRLKPGQHLARSRRKLH